MKFHILKYYLLCYTVTCIVALPVIKNINMNYPYIKSTNQPLSTVVNAALITATPSTKTASAITVEKKKQLNKKTLNPSEAVFVKNTDEVLPEYRPPQPNEDYYDEGVELEGQLGVQYTSLSEKILANLAQHNTGVKFANGDLSGSILSNNQYLPSSPILNYPFYQHADITQYYSRPHSYYPMHPFATLPNTSIKNRNYNKLLNRINQIRRPINVPEVLKLWNNGESKFPPFLEFFVQRIQKYFSNYVYEDQSRPVNYTNYPSEEDYQEFVESLETTTIYPEIIEEPLPPIPEPIIKVDDDTESSVDNIIITKKDDAILKPSNNDYDFEDGFEEVLLLNPNKETQLKS